MNQPEGDAVQFPDRVVIEITGERYTTTVLSGEAVIAKRSMRLESRGLSRGEQKGDFYDDFEDDALAEALDGIQGEAFEVAQALRED